MMTNKMLFNDIMSIFLRHVFKTFKILDENYHDIIDIIPIEKKLFNDIMSVSKLIGYDMDYPDPIMVNTYSLTIPTKHKPTGLKMECHIFDDSKFNFSDIYKKRISKKLVIELQKLVLELVWKMNYSI